MCISTTLDCKLIGHEQYSCAIYFIHSIARLSASEEYCRREVFQTREHMYLTLLLRPKHIIQPCKQCFVCIFEAALARAKDW